MLQRRKVITYQSVNDIIHVKLLLIVSSAQLSLLPLCCVKRGVRKVLRVIPTFHKRIQNALCTCEVIESTSAHSYVLEFS